MHSADRACCTDAHLRQETLQRRNAVVGTRFSNTLSYPSTHPSSQPACQPAIHPSIHPSIQACAEHHILAILVTIAVAIAIDVANITITTHACNHVIACACNNVIAQTWMFPRSTCSDTCSLSSLRTPRSESRQVSPWTDITCRAMLRSVKQCDAA